MTTSRKLISLLLLLAAAGVLLSCLRVAGVSASFDRVLWDVRFALDERPVSGEIVFVDIDAKSLEALGVWPLPRRLHGDVIRTLSEAGAQDIVFDIDFSASSNPEDDRLFASAMEDAGNVSLAVFYQPAEMANGADKIYNQPLEEFLEWAWPVVVMVPLEADSRVWRNLYGEEVSGSRELSVASYLSGYSGEASGSFGLDYSIRVENLPHASYVDILKGEADLSQFEGKKVIIGASALELRDIFAVPVYGLLPGAVIQALGAETLMQGRAMTAAGEIYAILFSIGALLLLALMRPGRIVLKTVVLAGASIALEVAAFGIQSYAPVLVPTATAHFIILAGAVIFVSRELGILRLLSHIADVKKRNSDRMLGLVFDDSFDAIVVVDADGKISAASHVARTMFCHDRLVGHPAETVLPKALVKDAANALAQPNSAGHERKILSVQGTCGATRLVEYVVTRSELTVANDRSSSKEQVSAVACVTCRDVTEERESAEKLEYLARFDPITGLMNRSGFEHHLAEKVETADQSGHELCLIQFAISNLDQIIASLGFSYGDEVRAAVAERLKKLEAKGEAWSAITADVFAGVMLFDPQEDDALEAIEKIRRIVGEDYKIDGSRISLQLKFGYVVSHAATSADTLLKTAGNALSKVRRDANLSVLAYRSEMTEALQRRRTLETELFKAISRDELKMVYQPLIDLENGSVMGAEALLRWKNHGLGPVSPGEFIPIAEESGYIVELGAWALNRAMREANVWPQSVRLSVNVSALQFSRSDFVATAKEALKRTGFPAQRLDLEITESLFIDEELDLKFFMEELKLLGCSFSLDDFGTGYSSLGYIPKYPFSKIKLDQSFVPDTFDNPKDIAIIESVVMLARGNGMSVLVEGIEKSDQAGKLKSLGCNFGQGYYFGRPVEAAEFLANLTKEAA